MPLDPAPLPPSSPAPTGAPGIYPGQPLTGGGSWSLVVARGALVDTGVAGAGGDGAPRLAALGLEPADPATS
jgi:hypothetical protein